MFGFALTGLVNGITSTLLGIFIVSRNPKNPTYSTYGLFCLSISVWGYSYFLWLTSTTPDSALFWSKILMLGATFIPITYLHHILILLNKTRVNRPLILFGYVFGLFAALADLTPFFVSGVEKKLFFDFWPNAGILYTPFLLIWFAYVLYGIFIIFREFLGSRGAQRNKIKFVLVATVIGWSGGATNYPLWYGIPLPPYGNIFVSIYILITAYAILKHRLMDIEVAVKKGFIYSVLIASIMAVYSLGIFVAAQLFQAFGISPWILAVLGSIVIAAGFLPLYNLLANITDKYFFRKKYEYQKVLLGLSKGLNQLMPLDTFAKLLVRRVIRTMRLDGAAVAIFDERENVFVVLDGQRQMTNLKNQKFSLGDTFIQVVTKNDYLLIEDVENQLKNKSLNMVEAKRLRLVEEKMGSLNVFLVVPAKFEKKTIGILFLGEKLSQEQYSDEDITLFTTLSNQTAMALTNVEVYDEALREFQAEHDKAESLQKQLDRSQRLASLGTIAAGVAHEIRNPLGILQLKSEELLNKMQDQQDAKYYRMVFDENISRVSSIISNMLNLTKTEKHEMKSLDLNQLIESTLQFFTISKVKLIKDLKSIPMITANAEELRHVFVNLIENALEAMPEGGELKLSTYEAEEDGKNFICAEVADTGIGISKGNLDKIFDPFFSTRHEGTGLGLSIVYRIVREHGASIDVKSEVGKGSTFTLKFPSAGN